MQLKPTFLLACVLGIFTIAPLTSFTQLHCDHTSTGNIPLNDLGPDFFMGYQGGLYPGGSNTIPASHQASGVSIAKSLKPLNSAGAVDPEEGKIVMAAFGASTAGNTFNSFKALVNPDPAYNPCLKFVNLCLGGKGLESMQSPLELSYWDFWIDTILYITDVTAPQVQVAWIKTASKEDSIAEFPLQADSLYEKYIRCIQRAKQKFPNLKLLYIGSHPYGGYADSLSDNADLAGEPASYYQGFGIKWVVEAQINGDPRLKYFGAGTKAPWIAWAPYVWADGLTPRETDGLTWECEDYMEEGGGFHLSEAGRDKEADILINFFYNHPTTKKWFRAGPMWNSCTPFGKEGEVISNDELELFPSPNNGEFYISFPVKENSSYSVSVFNSRGEKVFDDHITDASPSTLVHIPGVSSGIYFLQVNNEEMKYNKSFVINR